MISGLNVPLLYMAMVYSDLAYSGIGSAKKFHCWWSSATAYLVAGEEMDLLVFVGSKQPMDFLIDATAIPYRYGRCKSHAGFNIALWSIWSDIKKELRPRKSLLVTGHSLGGAMAEKACELLIDFPNDLHLVTFGKPNVYLKSSKPNMDYLNTQVSVVAGSDIVTRLPRYAYGPDSSQTMLYLANNGMDYIDPDREFIIEDWDHAELLTDHSITREYKPRIQLLMDAHQLSKI